MKCIVLTFASRVVIIASFALVASAAGVLALTGAVAALLVAHLRYRADVVALAV